MKLQWGTVYFTNENGTRVCWIEKKVWLIFYLYIYDNTEILANHLVDDIPYFHIRMEFLIKINNLIYIDLHHDCKPYR